MRRLFTPEWLGRHVLAAVLAVGFLALGWWQIDRAASGNTLSWAYAVEWPVFAGFVGFIWWREIRRELRPGAEPDNRPTSQRPAEPLLTRGDVSTAGPDGAPAAGPDNSPAGGPATVPGRPAASGAVTGGFRRPVLVSRPRYGDVAAGPAGSAGPNGIHGPAGPNGIDGIDGPDGDGELAAYNEYLAWLNAHPEARPGDYRKSHR